MKKRIIELKKLAILVRKEFAESGGDMSNELSDMIFGYELEYQNYFSLNESDWDRHIEKEK